MEFLAWIGLCLHELMPTRIHIPRPSILVLMLSVCSPPQSTACLSTKIEGLAATMRKWPLGLTGPLVPNHLVLMSFPNVGADSKLPIE